MINLMEYKTLNISISPFIVSVGRSVELACVPCIIAYEEKKNGSKTYRAYAITVVMRIHR